MTINYRSQKVKYFSERIVFSVSENENGLIAIMLFVKSVKTENLMKNKLHEVSGTP